MPTKFEMTTDAGTLKALGKACPDGIARIYSVLTLT